MKVADCVSASWGMTEGRAGAEGREEGEEGGVSGLSCQLSPEACKSASPAGVVAAAG